MQKIKNIFSKTAEYIKSLFNDGGKFSLHRSLIMLFVLSVWTVMYQMVAQSFNLLQLYGPILLLNIVPVFLIMVLLYFIIGKISAAFVITNTALSALLLINHFKVKFRDEPLNPIDFSLVKETKNIMQNYDITVDGIVLIVIAVCAISFWFVLKKIKNKRPGLLISVIGIGITSVLSICAYNAIYTNTRLYNALLSNLGIYHEATIVSSKGLVYSLLNSSTEMKYQKPPEYTTEKAEDILNRYPDNKLPENTPNVIAIMCEAFTDIQDWENISFNGENPYAYYNSLKQKGCYGHIFVPGFGGGTAQTEFEFLTGNNTSLISPSLPSTYKTHLTGQTYSIVRDFKELGFEANAMHPGFPWFYNRQNVYPRMGFDSFTSREALSDDIPETNTYANDSVLAEMIINDYNRHLEESPDTGYFNFSVTIQNHGPYYNDSLAYGTEYLEKAEYMTDEEYYIINNYLGGIQAASDTLKTIYEYINTLDQPTVLLFFGDHLPFLDDEYMLFEKLGLNIDSNIPDEFENKCSTDYIIVGNKAFTKSTKPKIKGEQEFISANYLSVKLYEYMNAELPQRQAFIKDVMEFAPILSKKHQGMPGSFKNTLTDEQKIMLDEYKAIQYYNIKDYKIKENNQ